MVEINENKILERQILSKLLKNKKVFEENIEKINPDTFIVSPFCKWLIRNLIDFNNVFSRAPKIEDIKEILNKILDEKQRMQAFLFIKSILNEDTKGLEIDILLDKLKRNFLLYSFLKKTTEFTTEINKENVEQIILKAQIELSDILEKSSSTIERKDLEVTDLKGYFPLRRKKQDYIPTPIAELNEAIGKGMKRTHLFIISSPTGHGKSAVLLNFANYANLNNFSVLFVTLEMSKEDVIDRLLAMITGRQYKFFYNSEFSQEEERDIFKEMIKRFTTDSPIRAEMFNEISKMKTPLNKIEIDNIIEKYRNKLNWQNAKFLISDLSGRITVNNLRIFLNKLKKSGKPIDLLVIDFLNMLYTEKSTGQRWEDLGLITRELKDTAKMFNIPVLTACQLSGAYGERLTTEDLKYSRAIGEVADWVIAFKRSPEDILRGTIQLEITKHRFSPAARIEIKERFDIMRIEGR